MAVEHAPAGRRGFFGSFPQIGTPLCMIVATAVLLALTSALVREAFAAWGWRLPFLFSVALIVVGSLIRRAVEESPVFERMHQRRKESSAPLRQLLGNNARQVVLTALIFVANNAAGYLLIAFFISYGQKSRRGPRRQGRARGAPAPAPRGRGPRSERRWGTDAVNQPAVPQGRRASRLTMRHRPRVNHDVMLHKPFFSCRYECLGPATVVW